MSQAGLIDSHREGESVHGRRGWQIQRVLDGRRG